MTERERFIKALKREKLTGHVPHFELAFYLTMESVGRVHPLHQRYLQWNQMSNIEKKLHMDDMAAAHIEVAEKYNHSAIFVHPKLYDYDSTYELLNTIRDKIGDQYFLMIHGDPTYGIPDGDQMVEFTAKMYEQTDMLKEQAQKRVGNVLRNAEKYSKSPGLLDGFALCSDYCFNANPFYSPTAFSDLIAPYLKETLNGYRELGFYTIKHTDGNIMPIIDQMVQCEPDAIHSLDPQGGVDLNEVRDRYGDRVALIGNVNCGLLQTGTLEECEADIKRSLRDGMKSPGYIFSTSNCVYTGLALERYEFMNKIWREEGKYPGEPETA